MTFLPHETDPEWSPNPHEVDYEGRRGGLNALRNWSNSGFECEAYVHYEDEACALKKRPTLFT